MISATVRRFRPIMLTAILALIPLTQGTFWAPMTVAIIGGLFIATVLDRLALPLPALYVAWFRIQPPESRHPEIAEAVSRFTRCLGITFLMVILEMAFAARAV